MFTADEVVWLTQPLSIRPAQYRPDVVLRMREAANPENLWAKDYKPTTIQREACRRLLKLTQLLAEESDPNVIEGIDDALSETTLDEDDPSDLSESIISHASSPGEADSVQEYHTPATAREEEPCMVVG